MPYKLSEDKLSVLKEDGTLVKKHPNPGAAQAHLAALNKNVDDAKSMKVGARNSAGDLALGRTAKAKLKAAEEAITEAQTALDAMGIFDEELSPEEESEEKSIPLFNYVKHLHISEDEEMLRDLIAVKSVARDTIRGYSMLWGDASAVDLENEFFTKSTDFWDAMLKDAKRPLTWEHGQEPQTKASPIVGQIVDFGDDDVGRWYVAQLDRAHQYRKAIDALISKREVGTSSDSAPQYVVRERAGKAVWLKQWPWFASALTTTPAEPRMFDAGSLYWKSLGIDTARMGGLDSPKVEIPDELRREAALIKYKVGTP